MLFSHWRDLVVCRPSSFWNCIALFVLLLLVSPSQVQAQANWPLLLEEGSLSATIYEPTYEQWDFLRVEMQAPVRVTRSGEAPLYCNARITARTFADRPAQRMSLRGFTVESIAVSSETKRSATGKSSPESLTKVLGELIRTSEVEVDLNHFVGAMAGNKKLPSVAIASETPRIFSHTGPAILLQFDGPPMWLPVDGTKISHGVNTNWEIFYDNKSTFYYLLADDVWLATHDLYDGEWVIPKLLPKEIKQLPNNADFAVVRKHLPYTPDPGREKPKVFYSEKAAELVLVDGKPALERVAGTPLSWVNNTESDLFYHHEEALYYLVIAGRWFTAARLEDYWRSAPEPPGVFAQVPPDHPRARILAHVPGTRQAEFESLWAQVPQLARIRRKEAAVDVAFAGKPQYVPIDGTSLLWVPNATVPVVAHAGNLYACHHAVWFRASNPEGPWNVSDSVPPEIYRIPPRSAAFHLSFVRLVESDATTVTFGYTGGYKNTYVHNGVVVYGTGYDHPPALQYGAYTYPVYFAQPATFGAGAWYDTKDHAFLRGRPGYGPYGGFGATSRYNSVTSHYFRPQGLYGVDNANEPELAFHPYTGVYGSVSTNYEPYSTWGKAVDAWRSRTSATSRERREPVAIQAGEPVIDAPDGSQGVPEDRSKPSRQGFQRLRRQPR